MKTGTASKGGAAIGEITNGSARARLESRESEHSAKYGTQDRAYSSQRMARSGGIWVLGGVARTQRTRGKSLIAKVAFIPTRNSSPQLTSSI
jgi:hypothetical protein